MIYQGFSFVFFAGEPTSPHILSGQY